MRSDRQAGRRIHRRRWVLNPGLVALAFLVGACEGEPEETEPVPAAESYEGVSLDEIQQRAESMTPEQAESLGIIDTTIRIQPPMNPDSVAPLTPPIFPSTDSVS